MWRVSFCKSPESGGSNRLRTVECNTPRAEIELRSLVLGNAVDTGIVSEIRSAACCAPITGHRPQPSPRILKKGAGRHHDPFATQVKRLQRHANEAHVMKHRQPADHHAFTRVLE